MSGPHKCFIPILSAFTLFSVSACADIATEKEIENPLPITQAEKGRFPQIEIVNIFEPEGESNVRSSFTLSDGVGLIGTEETGDIFKTEDAGNSWRKVLDGGDAWGIMDVRNYIRAKDGHLYITTTEPAMVCRSKDEGESWQIVACAPGTRTVGLIQLDNDDILVGIRRSFEKETSLLRSTDYFKTVKWTSVSKEQPAQNVTCFHEIGGGQVLAGVGYQGSGKIYKSNDYGQTWEKKADYPEARDMMWFFNEGDKIFIQASGIATLYASTDGGETWNKDHQFWSKGFLGMATTFEKDGKRYRLLSATDQREKTFRHVVLISDDQGESWFEWIEMNQDMSGGASNITVLSDNRIVVGTGNHSAQGRAFTLEIK